MAKYSIVLSGSYLILISTVYCRYCKSLSHCNSQQRYGVFSKYCETLMFSDSLLLAQYQLLDALTHYIHPSPCCSLYTEGGKETRERQDHLQKNPVTHGLILLLSPYHHSESGSDTEQPQPQSNAHKHTAATGAVCCRVEREGEHTEGKKRWV